MVVGLQSFQNHVMIQEERCKMYHFFVDSSAITKENIQITGQDVNHIMNVLRLKAGEPLIISDGEGLEYRCVIEALTNEAIQCKIQSVDESISELPIQVTLYQGAPKQDKMEQVTQKCVELGVHEIVSVQMRRSIVKYEPSKALKKVQRWNGIAESAAKQSKRGMIPKVRGVLKWRELLTELEDYDKVIIPYENTRGMMGTKEVFQQLHHAKKIAVIIGPEGGFDPEEIEQLLSYDGELISLGNRILRTETAGMVFMAMLMYEIEEA